jgi:hypothetical protein
MHRAPHPEQACDVFLGAGRRQSLPGLNAGLPCRDLGERPSVVRRPAGLCTACHIHAAVLGYETAPVLDNQSRQA